MLMKLLWMFLPDEFVILVIVGVALAMIVGLVRGRTAAGIIGGLILMLLAQPLIDALVDALPGWLLLLVLLWLVWWTFRALASLLLGREAAGHMTGILAADVVRFIARTVFWIIALPFRLIGGALRRGY
jgi:hypothetical protein